MCFGHQVIALAMGGTCVRNTREVSATKLRLNELGKKVYGVESGVLVGVSQFPLLLCSYSHKEPSFDESGPRSHRTTIIPYHRFV
jgi:GMP synthase-like glutamine amidotransferase